MEKLEDVDLSKVKNPRTAEPPKQIDLSKIKNLDAMKKVSGDEAKFAEKIEKKAKLDSVKNAKSKFNFTEEYDIQLPSKGRFYQDEEDEDIRNGLVHLRPMSITEEEIMSNQAYTKNGSMFRRIYDNCITNNFQSKHLVSYDSLFLMYALRNITYGDDYTIKLKCPECENEYTHTFNVTDVPFEEIPEDVEDKKTIKLPASKFTVVISMSRLQDDEELERMKKAHPDVSERILSYVIKTEELYNDENEPIDPKDWIDFYTVLPGRDRVAINKASDKDGTAPRIDVICPKCGNEYKTNIPFQSDFFRAS